MMKTPLFLLLVFFISTPTSLSLITPSLSHNISPSSIIFNTRRTLSKLSLGSLILATTTYTRSSTNKDNFYVSSTSLSSIETKASDDGGVKDNTKDPILNVWDDTLSPKTLSLLHKVASQRGLGHNVFTRRSCCSTNNSSSSKKHYANPIEKVLDELLTKMNDTSPIVEYWTRQEWRHIEAHSDIDEHLIKEQLKQLHNNNKNNNQELEFRFPNHGHVLYLQVGSEVRGPTCVFLDCSFGGELASISSSEVDLITVPAVPSRILRFHGNLLHAVPRPTDIWMLPFVKGSPQHEPMEEWGRSVILFNTWGSKNNCNGDNKTNREEEEEEEEEDQFVNGGPKSVFPAERMLFDEDEEDYELKVTNQWKHVYEKNKKSPHNEESSCSSSPSQTTEKRKEDILDLKYAKVWLLGDIYRRKYQGRTIKLYASESELRSALDDPAQIHQTTLYA